MMGERFCPQCMGRNPLENRFCGQCGASLGTNQLVPRQETGLSLTNYALPVVPLKRVGQAVLVSLVGLAAEVGLMWLRRRVGQMQTEATPATPVVGKQSSLVPFNVGGDEVTVSTERVVTVWQRGRLISHAIERTLWRRRG